MNSSRRTVLLCAALAVACGTRDAHPTLMVAASFQNAVAAVTKTWATNPQVQVAASSVLARQIVQGARGDCFVSANGEWMDYLAERDCLEPGTRQPLVQNRLVLVAPCADADCPASESTTAEVVAQLTELEGRLAMGDPSHVPAGMYGRRALQELGVWTQLAPRVVPTADVRAALALVARGEVDLGVVYATDAAMSKRVRVVLEFATPEVVYEIALLRGGDPALLRQLTGAGAQSVYQKLGFSSVRR